MYVTVIQGDGRIGFLDSFEIKDELKRIGAKWHPSAHMWVLTTSEDIGAIMARIRVDALDYRIGDSLDCTGDMDRILFSS